MTTGNGSLVYAPPNGSSFSDDNNPAGGAGYTKVISLKHSGSANGTLVVTFDDVRLIPDQNPDPNPAVDTQNCLNNPIPCHQEYPIFRSTDNGTTWQKTASINPSLDFPGTPGQEDTTRLSRTAEPYLYELPQQAGSLPAGTTLLTFMIRPKDQFSLSAVSKLVVYKSLDHGVTWSYLSTVDTGGRPVYDPSANAKETTVWEPSLALNSNGDLVCYFSDERQKTFDNNGNDLPTSVLQAVSYRASTNGGQSWGVEGNVAAVPNDNDRPGMITVTRMPNGKYLATFEVVNKTGYGPNASPVFYKISADGLDWGDRTSIGTPIQLRNGLGIGSSPFVRWVPTGGPNGMVVVASKWALDANRSITEGQDFYVNYNLGQGPWERMPFPVTFDGPSMFTGFSQGVDYSPDGLTLYQATNVDNYRPDPNDPTQTYYYNDIRVGSVPLNAQHYEGENASLNHVQTVTHADASNGSKVGYINYADSSVTFTVRAPAAGTYTVNVRYDNGTGANSSHAVSVNGGTAFSLDYPPTKDWGRFLWAQFTTSLQAGTNTIRFSYQGTYAELDQMHVYRPGVAQDPEFQVINRNSGKLLEITSAATNDGAGAGQWGPSGNPTQIWQTHDIGSGFYEFHNKNSGKLLEIPYASTVDGTQAGQWGFTGNPTQNWSLSPTTGGNWQIINRNSGKYLEIYQAALNDGGIADQWSNSGCSCQEWTFQHEGVQ